MAKFDYVKAQKTASKLVEKFGQLAPLVRVNSTYDAVTGVHTMTSYNLTNAKVVSLPASSGVQAFDNRFREDLKKGKIRFFYLAAKDLSFEPEGGDKIFFEGESWDIAGGTPLNPAGVHLISTVGCRLGDKKTLGNTLEAIAASTANGATEIPACTEGEGGQLITNEW